MEDLIRRIASFIYDSIARKSCYIMNSLVRIIVVCTIMFSVLCIIGYSFDLYRHGTDKHLIGWFSSGGFVLLTIPISIRLIIQHLTHWVEPNIQKYVVRIIWMVPIYSIESWFALRFKSLAIYIETLRECYEAYVIFSFLYFLIALLGDEQQIISKLKEKSADHGVHKWPISLCVSPWMMGHELLHKCKFGVLQYVIIKNLFALMVFILTFFNWYQEDKLSFDRIYLYECIVNNISQLWALYCLIYFYFAMKEELSIWRPVGKFLCVKMVVFFTWWQSLIIFFISSYTDKISDKSQQWTPDEVSKGIQDYLICIEMFFASIAFTFAFTHRDYISRRIRKDDDDEEEDLPKEEVEPFLSAFLQSSVPDDMFADIRRLTRITGFSRNKSEENNGEEETKELMTNITKSHSNDSIESKIGELGLNINVSHQSDRNNQIHSSKDRDNNNNDSNNNSSIELDNLEDIELQNITTTNTSATTTRIGLSHIHDPKNRIR